jgi:hypothetical protein
MAHSPEKNLRAVSFKICWLSLNPNCIAVSLMEARSWKIELRR